MQLKVYPKGDCLSSVAVDNFLVVFCITKLINYYCSHYIMAMARVNPTMFINCGILFTCAIINMWYGFSSLEPSGSGIYRTSDILLNLVVGCCRIRLKCRKAP